MPKFQAAPELVAALKAKLRTAGVPKTAIGNVYSFTATHRMTLLGGSVRTFTTVNMLAQVGFTVSKIFLPQSIFPIGVSTVL